MLQTLWVVSFSNDGNLLGAYALVVACAALYEFNCPLKIFSLE